MSVSLDLARRAAGLTVAELPAEVRRAARVSLADAVAVMAAAAALEPMAAPYSDVARAAGAGGATLIAGGSAAPALAALANGALAHALDYEDTFDAAGLHPNAPLVPAVLALAEAEGADDEDVLAALVLGADLTCRIGLGLGADPAARGWYHPPMLACLGAAFGAARLLRLPPEGMVAALSLAACRFALTEALKHDPASPLRAVRDGLAAEAAVQAALLARAGAQGVAEPLAGPGGVFDHLTGTAPLPALWEGHGHDFPAAGVAIKPWPCCRGTHPFVALALALRDEGVTAEDIRAARVTARPPDDMLLLPRGDRQAPGTAIGARFSIPYAFAAALTGGPPGLAAFADPAAAPTDLRALAGRVTLEACAPDLAPGVSLDLPAGTLFRPVAQPPAALARGVPVADLAVKLEDCLGAAGKAATAGALLRAVGLGGGDGAAMPAPAPLRDLLRVMDRP